MRRVRILLDTNILGRYSQPNHVQHAAVMSSLEQLASVGHELRTVPQVIYEYWVIATRPASSNGLGFSTDEAMLRVADFLELFPLLRDERGIFERWLEAVRLNRCTGKAAHDARLVGAMLRHGVSAILTFNMRDFARYRDLDAINPDDVARV